MIIVLDIGNTNISLGLFKGKSLIRSFDFPTKDYRLGCIQRLVGGISLQDAIISSVVPRLTIKASREIKQLTGSKVFILGKNIKVPMKNLYRLPEKLGSDRIVNAYAGYILYGAPLIVVDFGTAVTFDIVSQKGEYLGGVIFPGMEMSLRALSSGTSLLPRLSPRAPRELIGRDTVSGMHSGIVHGYAALTDCLCKRIKEQIGKNARIVATGGSVRLLEPYCHSIDRVNENLTLEGLNLVYYNVRSSA